MARCVVVGYALIDDEDAHLAQYRWALNYGYVVSSPRRGVKLRMHREVLGLQPGDGLEADHINGDPLDNRRSNLRIATRQQNGQNVPVKPGSRSRFRGVFYEDSRPSLNRWRVRPRLNGRSQHVGWFATEEEAGAAALAWYAENMPFANLDRCVA